MGSEILDSSGGTRSVAPGPAVDERPDSAAPLVELDELAPVQIDPPPSAPPRSARPLAAARRLWGDPDRRRTALRIVLSCALLMALTASVVEFRASRRAAALRDGQIAVDIRVDEVHPASRSFELSGAPADGTVTVRVEVHNMGPQQVQLMALDVTHAGAVQIPNDISDTTAPLEAGGSIDTTYNVHLPCRSDQQSGFGTPEMTAQVRTADRALHAVPVNLTTINEQGGLLTACIEDEPTTSDSVSAYSSTSDGNSVVMTIVVGGDASKVVTLVTPNVGVPVRYVAVPRLPVRAQPGITLVVKVTPQVTQCSRTPVNFDALPGVGVRIGTESVSDTYLPALVAQAAGRACGGRQ
jgi:hypothetical protein